MEINGEIKTVENVIELMRKFKERIKNPAPNDSFVNFLKPDNFIYGLWFRGEKDFKEKGLTPSVFRQNGDKELSETTIFNYLPTINNNLRNLSDSFDRLSHMQHYDIPTRLLDWTDNILIALYFGVAYELKNETKDSKLYALNARALNHISSFKSAPLNIHVYNSFGTQLRMLMVHSEYTEDWFGKVENQFSHFDWKRQDMNKEFYKLFNFKSNKNDFNSDEKAKILSTPIAVRPNTVNNRLLFQNGLFTLHGGKIGNGYDVEKNTPLPRPMTLFELNEKSEQKIIETYLIPKEFKKEIKYDLLNLRIHEGSLFPELDKQAKFVKLISE